MRAPTATRYRVAIARPLHGATQNASAEFVLRDYNFARRFGVVLRYENASNYYVAYRMTGGTSVLRLARIVNGLETVLGQKSVGNPARNAWFRLGGRAEGQRLTLELEGVPIFSVSTRRSRRAASVCCSARRARRRSPRTTSPGTAR